MPQARRNFKSNHLYEICFRAREGLPFAVTYYMHLLIESIVARAQRDFKVVLCHHLWMGSHPHILAILKDAELARRFYMEVEKKLTDAVKRLLGLEHLNLWEKTPRVIEICDLASAIKKIAYYYANPAAAHLVDCIEEYPGLSSWRDFVAVQDKLNAMVAHRRPWIRLPSIPKLPARAVTETQDKFITARLKEANKKKFHTLELFPNAWMECFGIKDDAEVAQINACIIARLRHNEDVCRRWRARKGWKVLGANKLRAQPIMAPHTPKKYGRRIFCIAATIELRVQVIAAFRKFCEECRRCYKCWCAGDVSVFWPPGAFLPPLPPSANALG
jgi:hypothetical protein